MGDQHKALVIEGLVGGAGGGGGTSDYSQLTNKPQINGITLSGNKSSEDIGITEPWVGTQVEYAQAAATIPAGTPVVITDDTDIDTTPTQGSNNPVTSNGIHEALETKVDKVTGKQLSTEDFTKAYKNGLSAMMADPLNHNGIYRGKDLTSIYTIEQMYERVHDGSFDDLYLGDYFTVHLTTDLYTRFTGSAFESGVDYYEMGGGTDVTARTWTLTEDETPQSGKTYATKLTKTENITLMFAAFDYYYNIGDTAIATHHAILIPRGAGFVTTANMNPTNTTAGGYYGTDMHQITLPCYAKSLKTALNNHLLAHRTWLTTTVNASTPSMAGAGLTGAASASAWKTTELQLMNEIQLYGSMAWSSSAYDVGVDNEKLPVFNFINPVQFASNHFWLRTVASSTYFAHCSNNGYANANAATYALSVRPLILFG